MQATNTKLEIAHQYVEYTNKNVFLTGKAVSYTHLDVYKRQTIHKGEQYRFHSSIEEDVFIEQKDKTIKVLIEDTIACPRYSGISITGVTAVSYTHLDVYKRQPMMEWPLVQPPAYRVPKPTKNPPNMIIIKPLIVKIEDQLKISLGHWVSETEIPYCCRFCCKSGWITMAASVLK